MILRNLKSVGPVAVVTNSEAVTELEKSLFAMFQLIDKGIKVVSKSESEGAIYVVTKLEGLEGKVGCVLRISPLPSERDHHMRWIVLQDPLTAIELDWLSSDSRAMPNVLVLHYFLPAANVKLTGGRKELQKSVEGLDDIVE